MDNNDSSFGAGLRRFLAAPSIEEPTSTAGRRSSTTVAHADLAAIAEQEGAGHLTPVISAIYGQESAHGANGKTSTDGARGGMQIIPATFARFARPGEQIDNPDDNMRVGVRLIKSLGDRFNNDPGRIAAGYFSGEGNVNPTAEGSAWRRDHADGNGKRVSSYVSDVLARLPQQADEAVRPMANGGLPDLSKQPKWRDIEAGAKFQKLPDAEKQALKSRYFDELIAPHAKAAGADVQAERQKFMAVRPQSKEEPGALDKALGVAKDIGVAIVDAVTPAKSVMEGRDVPAAQDLPTTSRVPVKPEVRAAFNAAWDAATPEKRQAMQAQEGWNGMLARERAGVFERRDKTLPNSQVMQSIDPRIEARRATLIAQGEDPRFAERAALEGASRGVMPGQEISSLGGTVQKSEFDFDTKKLFDTNGPINGLNNPLARGIAKAGAGTVKAISGLNQAIADTLGADEYAAWLKRGGNWARGKEDAIGESGTLLERNFEGAINSIAQQLPLLITGATLEKEAIPLAGMALQSFGQEYSDGRSKGQSTGQAMTRASVFAAFEVIGEKFGLKENMQAIKAAARGLPSDQILGFLWSALKKEVPGELLTTTGQFATDKWAPGGVGLNPNATGADYLKQVADTIAQTIMQSGMMAGGTTGVSKGVQFLKEKGDSSRLAEIQAENAKQKALSAWSNGLGGKAPESVSMTPDGRIEPTMTGKTPVQAAEPAPVDVHPTVQTADAIVRDLATEAGVPLETVLPTAQQATTGPEAVGDQEVQAFAEGRYQQLRTKRDGQIETTVGETGIVDHDVPGAGLSVQEQQELAGLEQARGDVSALRTLYGLDQSIPSDQSQFATQANEAAPATGPVAQNVAGQQFPATMEPGLLATQENQSENGPDPQLGAAQHQTPVGGSAVEQKSAALPVEAVTQRFSSRTGDGSVTYSQRPDGRVDRIVRYDDGEEMRSTLVTDKNGDEHWVSDASYGKGAEHYPVQASTQQFNKIIHDDLESSFGNAAVGDAGQQAGDVQPQAPVTESEDDREARLEREAIQAEHEPLPEQPFQYDDIPLYDEGQAVSATNPFEDAAPAKPRTEKEARARRDYSDKLFGTQDKAEQFIAKQGIGATHAVVQDGKKFLIQKKESSNTNQAAHAQQAEAQPAPATTEAVEDSEAKAQFDTMGVADKQRLLERSGAGDSMVGGAKHNGKASWDGLRPQQKNLVKAAIESGKLEVGHAGDKQAAAAKPTAPKTEREARELRAAMEQTSLHETPTAGSADTIKHGNIAINYNAATQSVEAFHGDKKIGEFMTEPLDSGTSVADMYIEPEYQRQGIGRQMLDMAIAHLPGLTFRNTVLTREGRAFAEASRLANTVVPLAPAAGDVATPTPAVVQDEPLFLNQKKEHRNAHQTAQAKQAEAQGSERQQAPGAAAVDQQRSFGSDEGDVAGTTAMASDNPQSAQQKGPYSTWRDSTFAERGALLRHAGYTDTDQNRVLSGTDWSNLTDPVRKVLSAAHQKKTDAAPGTNKADPFAGNKIFTADKIEAARARLKARLGTLNSGIDPELLVDGMTIAGGYIESGVRRYSDYTKAMVEDFGEKIRPYLRSFYEAARNYPGLDTAGMTTAAELDLMEQQGTAEHTKATAGMEAAIGEIVKAPKRTRERKTAGASTLRDDYGVSHIDGYDGNGETSSGPVKTQFLNDTRNYLKDVSKALEARGFIPATGRNGKPVKPVSVNEGGPAGSGDVTLAMFHPELDRGIYIHIGDTALRGVVPSTKSGISVMMRTTKAGDPWGGDQNRWMPVAMTSAELAGSAADAVEKNSTKTLGLAVEKPAGVAQNELTAKEPPNANPVQPENVSQGNSGETQPDAATRNRDSESVGVGLAKDSQGLDGDRGVSGRADDAGAAGAQGTEPAGQQPSGSTRDRAGVRAESGPARSVESGIHRNGTERDESADNTGAVRQEETDHVIDADEIGKGGLGQKYRDNVAAIRILKTLESEGRTATAEERKALAKYAGWGAMKGPFDPGNKAWAKQHAEIKELLTAEEFRAARASTLDAHYTSPVAVGAMYDALARLGVKSGRVLEPSVGVGNFFGLMPREMRNASQLHGVELDSLTSRLVAALYPKAKIAKATGFQDFEIPSEYFDVVIGNPPFGSHPLVDKERSAYSGFSIHNYFLAKSIDKLRPGGVMAIVVSHNFLDAQDGRVRKWIGDRASLIGGVRLPNTAFKENAGTEVVTDILIFQKHDKNGLPSSVAPWQAVVEQININPKTGEHVTHKVSQFFVANPQFVLGKPSAGGSMYSANEYTVEQDGNIKDALAKWVKTLPENTFDNINRAAVSSVVDMAVPDGIKEGSFYVDASGKVMRRGDDLMGEKTATTWEPRYESQVGRMKGMIAIRDALRQQMRLERSVDATEQDIEANRANLNRLYDDFLKKYKHINSTTNRSIFLDDTEAHLIQGLEFDYDKGIGKAAAEKEGIEPREAKATKADIFKRRVAFPPQDYMTVTTAKDALLASLNYRGRVDGAYMAEVYGKPMGEIVKELGDVVFDDPQAGIVTADEYLSGDVKTKLAEAKAAAQDDAKYRRNVDALEKVIPKDKTPSEISVSIGAAFVPAGIYEQFVKHISGGSATAIYVKATGQWLMAFNKDSDPALNTGRFGTDDLSAQELFQLTMSGRGAVVKQTLRNDDGSTTTILLEKETEAAREKQNAIKAEWQKWVWQDPERADRIASLYNDKMNRIVVRKFDGSHMRFPGMNPAYELLAHQKNGVWRGLQDRQMLLDHVVGAGKTWAMVTQAMEMRRLGIARKPLFAVPNHLTQQWRSDFIRLYPGAQILVAGPEDFSKDNRERLFAKIITGDWDAVVIGHSSLKKIGLPEKTEIAVLQEQVDELTDAIENMKRARGDKRITADMERIRKTQDAKMKDKLAAVGKRSKMVTFDELGIDAMFIDEMHEFKNLTYNTTMDRTPGMGNPAGSAKAFDLFVKVRWLFDTFGDKTPFITATGTPVSNSLVEMFNMQRYMQYPTLKREGLHVFDAWAKQFGSVENVYEVAPSGSGYRQSTRFAKFTNLPGLMSLYNSFADTITLDDLKAQEEAQGKRFPVPKMVSGRPVLVVAKRSPAVAALMGVPKAQTDEAGSIQFGADLSAEIKITQDEKSGKWTAKVGDTYLDQVETAEDARLKVVERALTPMVSVDPQSILGRFANLRQLTKDTEGRVNALSLTGEANKAGLDYRLIDPAAPDFAGSKINLAVDNMLRTYKQWQADRGTQLVFCDLSIPLSARASYSSKARRLYVRDDAGGIEMKRGTLHALPGHEDLPYFVIQRGEKEAKRFDVHDAASGLRLQSDFRSKQEAIDAANGFLGDEAKRQQWINAREAAGEIEQGEIDEYNNEHEVDTENPALFFMIGDVAGVSGSARFSVYDDIKAKLIAKGVPEREIAFIHDYGSPTAKDKLFRAVNSGEVRFLLGSTPKMGAGTNVQERLVGLHHIDAPWRPSDLEQREGRIIRRGNELYARDPDNFEVFIGRYATEQTYDTRRWQILEHKARGIEQLRNYDGTLNEIDDIEGEAANSADMKAAASGDPMILEETKLRNDARRLELLQAGHADEVLSMTRKARDAQEYADTRGPATVREIKEILATTAKHPVDKEGFAPVSVRGGKLLSDKEAAHEALASVFNNVRSHMVDTASVQYRGLTFKLEHFANAVFMSTPTGNGGLWGATDPFSPSGMVQRLKNYIDRLPAMLDETQASIEKSKEAAESMRELAKQPFPQAKDLEAAREAHKKIQRALMAKGPEVPENQKAAVAAGMEQQKAKLRELGFGDALNEFFSNEAGPLFNNLARSPSYHHKGTPEAVRANALAKLKSLEKRRDAGKITEAEYRLGVQQLISQIEKRNDAKIDRRMESGRRRGADWIVAQLRRGVADETVPRNEAEFAEWLLEQNPNLANDLGISISGKDGNGSAGNYNPLARIIKLFSSTLSDNGTAVHEILHHTERMLPAEVQDGIVAEWQRAWDAEYKKATPEQKQAMDDMLAASLGDRQSSARVQAAFGNGTLTYDRHYQLFSPSEFWAVNATRILSGRFNARSSLGKRAVAWFKEFVQRMKGMLGLASDAPILKALDAVMRGDGAFQSKSMLVERDYSQWLNEKEMVQGEVAGEFNNITRRIQNNLIQFFGSQNLNTFNWYDKSIATQYHKAMKDKHFGKVYGLLLAMQNHVSMASLRPAALAPGVLPRVDDVRAASKELFTRKNHEALEKAGNALFAGTLAGDTVLDGKVWSDAELRTQFGLDDTGVALYHQARAAIDASLDEVAAGEAYSMASAWLPKDIRGDIAGDPAGAERMILNVLTTQAKVMASAIAGAKRQGDDERAVALEAEQLRLAHTKTQVERIFAQAKNLKKAGYAPLMRFGEYTVTAQEIDPATGNLIRNEEGKPGTLYFGKFETQAEANKALRELKEEYEGRDDVKVDAGHGNPIKHELYNGVTPETLELFADAIGAKHAADDYIRLTKAERSALKRRLERKGTPGFSTDLTRVLSSFVTSNARHASQQFYMSAINRAIKYIPKEKGDVQQEAQKLKKFVVDPDDAGALGASLMFAWFIGGSPAAAVINLTQPGMMTLPYLSQYGMVMAEAELSKAVPYAMGGKEITDKDLRAALKKASLEGVVDAQEIFHLYAMSSRQLATGTKTQAALTLWGSMFSAVEVFNRRLTFIAAWNMAVKNGEKSPYAFAIRAVNQTQGIYNKVNRPNFARSSLGRAVFTFKTYGIAYLELAARMWKSGPNGKRAVLLMLAILMLASGEEGLPFSKLLDDLIDTIGQMAGFDTNMRRNKRRLAYEILGKTGGDLFLYGASTFLPLDFGGRLGMGNVVPGTEMLKPSSGVFNIRSLAEVIGPTAGAGRQVGDFVEAATEGNYGKALENIAPKGIRDVISGVRMWIDGHATDAKGRKVVDVGLGDAVVKGVGFNPTKVAQEHRKTMPIQQDIALQKRTESAIVDQWARGVADGDDAMVNDAMKRRDNWNESNPKTPIAIRITQIRDRARQMATGKDARLLKQAPKEMRGSVALGLDLAD